MAPPVAPRPSELTALEKRGYTIGKRIGQGSYATVHVAEYVEGPKKIKLACKIFDKERAPKEFLDKFFPRELEILTRVDNSHVVQVHSILQRGLRVFIFMRHAENGDLLDFIKEKGLVTERQAKYWFRQMVLGLQYMHGLNIAHRDIKCENILLSKHWNIKLADFGFARYCADKDGHKVLSQTYCGSAAYAAPEVVSGIPYNPKMADVWSLGIVLFIMVNATMPFDDSNLKKLLRDQQARKWGFRARVRDLLSILLRQLVSQILEPDMTKRISLDQIAVHEWLRKEAPETSIPSHDQGVSESSPFVPPSDPLTAALQTSPSGISTFAAPATNTEKHDDLLLLK